MDPETPYPVIDLLPEQKEIEDLGGTMRLGAQAVEIAEGTRARDAYGEAVVHERHRHRYEVNNHYRPRLVEAGLVVSGTFQEGRLVEIVELPDHPVVRREPVPPGVQVAADAPGAALPRLRRRRARALARARRSAGRRCRRRRLRLVGLFGPEDGDVDRHPGQLRLVRAVRGRDLLAVLPPQHGRAGPAPPCDDQLVVLVGSPPDRSRRRSSRRASSSSRV